MGHSKAITSYLGVPKSNYAAEVEAVETLQLVTTLVHGTLSTTVARKGRC
jgi:hypothetical protein